MKTPITLGIDPAAPNGDCSAVAVIQGNRIHQILFNAMHSTDPVKLQGTVTGRFKSPYNPNLWQLPKNPCMEIEMPSSDPLYTYYLLRKMEVVATDAGNHDLPAFLHSQGQHGDVLVTRSYMGEYRVYFWAGKKKKYYWRKADSRKYPDLIPQLRVALLLQT